MVTFVLELPQILPTLKEVHYERVYLPVQPWSWRVQFPRRGGGARQNDSFSNKGVACFVWLTWNKKQVNFSVFTRAMETKFPVTLLLRVIIASLPPPSAHALLLYVLCDDQGTCILSAQTSVQQDRCCCVQAAFTLLVWGLLELVSIAGDFTLSFWAS